MTVPERTIGVWLHDDRVGMLRVRGDHSIFNLDQDYIRDPKRSVLGLRFEEDLEAEHRASVRLPPWFSNLLPEGRLREWIAEARGVKVAREAELLVQVGHDLPGAVRVEEVSDAPTASAVAVRQSVTSESERLQERVWRFSLAGVALKLSMLRSQDRFTAPAADGHGGDWIVKLPDSLHPHVPRNEHAMMTLARAAGLNVPDVELVHRDNIEHVPDELWPSTEELAYAVRRFDRMAGGGRVHIEDLAQVKNVYPDDKYEGTFETVASYVYRRRDEASLIELAKRLAFNIIIQNGDAHLKNWSLLYADPRVPTLAPAYDLVATFVYRPSDLPEDLGLKFDGSRKFENVSLATFDRLEKRLGADGLGLADHVADFCKRVQHAWPAAEPLLRDAPEIQKAIGDALPGRIGRLMR